MTLKCDICGSPDFFVGTPGSENVVTVGSIVVKRGQPMRCWCETCARKAGWPWLESERTRQTGQMELVL